MATLETLPLFKYHFPYAMKAKENVSFDFWTRPTLDWKLTCEEAHPRKVILDAFTNVDKVGKLSFILIKYGAIVLGGFTILCGFLECTCSVLSGGNTCRQIFCPIFVFFFAVTIQAALIAGIIWFSIVSLKSNDTRIKSMSILKTINDCSDDLTKLPAISIDSDLQDA